MYTVHSNDVQTTERFAALLAKYILNGMVITLEGDLGAGKTAFVRGFAKGLDITERIKSPTFTILKIYESGSIPLYHMDVYRLEHSEGEEGLYEYIGSDGVAMIEWAQFISEDLPTERLEIFIEYISDSTRNIQLQPIGKIYEELIEKVMKHWSEQ